MAATIDCICLSTAGSVVHLRKTHLHQPHEIWVTDIYVRILPYTEEDQDSYENGNDQRLSRTFLLDAVDEFVKSWNISCKREYDIKGVGIDSAYLQIKPDRPEEAPVRILRWLAKLDRTSIASLDHIPSIKVYHSRISRRYLKTPFTLLIDAIILFLSSSNFEVDELPSF